MYRQIADESTKKSAEDKISKWIGDYVLSYLQNNGIPEDERHPLDGGEPSYVFIPIEGAGGHICIPKEDIKKILGAKNAQKT